MTVPYGGETSEAALDHDWFAAVGVLFQQVTVTPRIQGYDAEGRPVYDCDEDKYCAKALP
ncbi:hypothetical protein [Streptomyces sp. 2A115]|uniref:hypothetical protein n=1 Tax=Streptomyces sp. 2A115 TaxID=3457439 RepID=UPI003FD08300